VRARFGHNAAHESDRVCDPEDSFESASRRPTARQSQWLVGRPREQYGYQSRPALYLGVPNTNTRRKMAMQPPAKQPYAIKVATRNSFGL
jgi:hypothetical protein